MRHIVTFSGGKDSTAMLLMMIEKKMPIDDIVFCDTGMEFSEIYKHIEKVSKAICRDIVILKAEYSFEWFLSKYKNKSGKIKDTIGMGWPGFKFRWCTGCLKINILSNYIRNIPDVAIYVGVAFDEQCRARKNKNHRNRYPLISWEVTEDQALHYCYKRGFDWGGLYELFPRAGCWCCPLQSEMSLRVLHGRFPALWQELERLDRLSCREFKPGRTIGYFCKKFEYEARQLVFPW
jgi:3'-phosphoadenosine 5'-phosphosulfate sulfotransferase (PAPS reductase)/FAD synthetase